MIKEFKNNTYKVSIVQDGYANDPREWCNLGTIVTLRNSRHRIGDETCSTWEEIEDTIEKVNKNNGLAIPVYIYDHSGISISTTPFTCKWDSSHIGYIYVTKEAIAYEKIDIEKAKTILKEEIEIYNLYLNNEIYGYECYKKFKYKNIKLDENDKEISCEIEYKWELQDSCGEFYATESMLEDMSENMPKEYADLLENKKIYS